MRNFRVPDKFTVKRKRKENCHMHVTRSQVLRDMEGDNPLKVLHKGVSRIKLALHNKKTIIRHL